MKASLFVTTYELPQHLELVCAGLARQSCREFEVLFCDDGSSPETAKIIQRFAQASQIQTQHIWQEHQGFRKCRILNRAIPQSTGPVLIFLDGDCIPHRDFIQDHLDEQEEGFYLAGRRLELGPKISAQLTPERVTLGFFDRPQAEVLWSSLTGDSAHFNRSIHMRSRWLRNLFKMNHIVDLKGCNYSVPRHHIEAINGFDESYEGYGREDTDVEIRLQNLGLKIKSMKGLALQFHVWHPKRDFTPANDERLDELKQTRRFRCKTGLIKDP
jgi:glycosyltransferase involved in cell wall biosynthesis